MVLETLTKMDWTTFNTNSGIPLSMTKASEVIPFTHRVIVGSFLIGLAIIGLFGNGLVIISVVVTKELRTITNILVVNLAFADFLTCLCLPFQVTGILSRTEIYNFLNMACGTVSGLIYTCVCCSGSTLVAIAYVRWYVITKSVRNLQEIYTQGKIALVVVMIWIESAVFMVVPPALGVGTLGYSEYFGMCATTDTNPLQWHYRVIQGIVISIVLVLIMVFYILIFRHVLRHNRQIRARFAVHDNVRPSAMSQVEIDSSPHPHPEPRPLMRAINKMEVGVTKNLFLVVCFFMLCFFPIGVGTFLPAHTIYTLYAYAITMMNSVVNPLIYGLKHPNFRKVFKSLICGHRLTLN